MAHPKNLSASEMAFAGNSRAIDANQPRASSSVCSIAHISQVRCGHFESRAESGSLSSAFVQRGRTARAVLMLFAVASSFASGNTKVEGAAAGVGRGPVGVSIVPSVRGPIPVSAGSEIFAPAVRPGTAGAALLEKAGYEQQEFLLSGTARVYGQGGPQGVVIERDRIPYGTRLVVVRPRNPALFSGNAHLTIGHPQFGMIQWDRISRYVLGHGDVYVAVMAGGDVLSRRASTPNAPVSAPLALKWFEPERYAAIEWPDDDAIRWDVFGQVALLLKGGDGPFADLKVERVYASGWSFIGSFLRTFIQDGFHERFKTSEGKPAIDGYLIGISSGSVGAGHVPVTSSTVSASTSNPDAVLRRIDVPIIELQSENEAVTNREPQTPDSDAIAGGHRLYELGGVSHTDIGRESVNPVMTQLMARHHPYAAATSACDAPPSDVPMADVAAAALWNLDRWNRTGIAPPRAEPIVVNALTHQSEKDEIGNTLGGIRVAQLDVALGRYGLPKESTHCAVTNPHGFMVIRRNPLDPETLRRLYPGGKSDYLARFTARLNQLVQQRWLVRADADVERQMAETNAASAFGH